MLTAAEICTLACQIAGTPGMTAQAGKFLNLVLGDLCRNYDLDAALTTATVNLTSATGSGPYALPDDYLRARVQDGKDDVYYVISGVPYPMIQITKTEYDWMVQTAGFSSYPYNYATAINSPSGGNLYVWPPSSGAYQVLLTYYALKAAIATPETSATVPWFPSQEILIRGTAGNLMGLSGDPRQPSFLGTGDDYPLGMGTLIGAYLKNAEDREGAVHTVGLDRRRWGRPFDRLRNTKTIGW